MALPFLLLLILLFLSAPAPSLAGDPFVYLDWEVSYLTAQPLGVNQKVFPGAWTAVLVFLDNAGIWNLRVENLDGWYLGREVYISVVNPEDSSDKTVLPLPDNTIFCGALSSLQKEQSHRFQYAEASPVWQLGKIARVVVLMAWLATWL